MVDLTLDEMRLAALALLRMRMEIDVDGDSKVQTMNAGQKQACRFTIVFVDALGKKLADAIKEASDG